MGLPRHDSVTQPMPHPVTRAPWVALAAGVASPAPLALQGSPHPVVTVLSVESLPPNPDQDRSLVRARSS